jgi:DivIVA domain-containing protein
MPLTPEDVSNKRFTPVRLREGYDMGEVDQFLDEVESELARLLKENDDLHERLRVAQENPPPAAAAEPAYQAPSVPEPEPEPEPTPPPAPAVPAYVEPTPVAAAPQEIRVTTVAEASSAAARLLEIAGNNADQIVDEAKVESERLLSEAKANAERLSSETKSRTDQLESEARTRAQMLDSETAERRNQLFGDLEKEKGRLNGEIENLRAFEREYRSRLKSYFTQQLASLETNEATSASGPPSLDKGNEPPKRLRSLLGDDEY